MPLARSVAARSVGRLSAGRTYKRVLDGSVGRARATTAVAKRPARGAVRGISEKRAAPAQAAAWM